MISSPKGDAKELRRARSRMLEVEVRVNGNVENAGHDTHNCPNNVVG
jgi:hypothetical protein